MRAADIGVFAVAAYRQWFGIDDFHRILLRCFLKSSTDRGQQFGSGGATQTTTHRRLGTKVSRPILPSAGPGNRPIVDDRSQEHTHDKRRCKTTPILKSLAEPLGQSVQLLPVFALHNRLLCVVTKAHYGRELFYRPELATA
jgi:hypothetical protein